ncbi:hypothetical protein [Cerasicoccus fimbriatus]|uniref:PDC sensor domain-containing protein n=1 Tax=Cerasicoccus fimbriatus TaxID=3014554 RepID=UPI0022B31774|nr:hypothetical protein [Cerasicoccus sp. TK19100]
MKRLAAITVLALAACIASAQEVVDVYKLLVQSSAQRIDDVFNFAAQSTEAIASEYQQMRSHPATDSDSMIDTWKQMAVTQGKTTGFRFTADKKDHAFQAPIPAFYFYGDRPLNDAIGHQLNDLGVMAPTLEVAYKSFDFSWVYITTSSELMVIYPFLPMSEAVNNYPPTEQIFYTCADFKNRRPGWSPPYLDLVGAGMMISVSTPVFVEDEPVAVVSRDITLKELTESVLSLLVEAEGAIAYIVDDKGLAIDVSDPNLAQSLEKINTQNKNAVVYYLPKESKLWPDTRSAYPSGSSLIDEATEAVLTSDEKSGVLHLTLQDKEILSARIKSTDWRLILLLPETQ